MTIIKHEWKQGMVSLIIWTASIGFLIGICILIFPDMKGEMNDVSDMFASMGGFTAAFGMDQLNFGTLTGFYAIECGNILGLGGAFYAALTAVTVLAKEEKGHTAEFLFSHPVSRRRVITEKLAAVMLQITALNLAVYLIAVGSVAVIGEPIPWKEISLLHLAYYLLQLEIGSICFGISAFLRKGSLGIGMGIAAILYFLNIIANLTESAEFIKYITPFGYAEGADIMADLSLNPVYVTLGILYAVCGIAAAYAKYRKKDIF